VRARSRNDEPWEWNQGGEEEINLCRNRSRENLTRHPGLAFNERRRVNAISTGEEQMGSSIQLLPLLEQNGRVNSLDRVLPKTEKEGKSA